MWIAGPSYGTMAAHQPLAASKQNRKVLAAVAVAALVAAAVGVVLSTRATGRQELVGSYRYVYAHFIFRAHHVMTSRMLQCKAIEQRHGILLR